MSILFVYTMTPFSSSCFPNKSFSCGTSFVLLLLERSHTDTETDPTFNTPYPTPLFPLPSCTPFFFPYHFYTSTLCRTILVKIILISCLVPPFWSFSCSVYLFRLPLRRSTVQFCEPEKGYPLPPDCSPKFVPSLHQD